MRWLPVRAHRWPLPEFLPRPVRPPLLAWAWLLCGALALAIAVDDALALQARRADLQAQLDRWQALARVKTAPRAATAGTPAPTAAAATAAQTVARGLEHPWLALFESTERLAGPGVRWLRLTHDAERGEVRLEASAARRDALLRTLDGFAAEPAWSDVMLLRVEDAGVTAASAGAGLRFELRARFGPAAPASSGPVQR